jgi:LuxR family maltose regulon positive regulatory protein
MMLDSVLKHAITPPSFDPTRLHRERLVDAIHANIPRKLIAIATPPGYGKTMLLADFSVHTELPVCWVRLTDADCDLMRLVTVLGASLQKRFRRLRGQLPLESMAGSAPAGIARAFASAIDSRVSEAFVIALDDVHLVNRSKPVLAFLDAFLEVQPDQVTMIAAGREVMDVSLARLMAEGSLAGLGPHDLALDRNELIALARIQQGVELDEDHAARLLDETRGWITGVLLSGMLSGHGLGELMQGARPMVYEYLASVVLNRQPDDLRRFILDSAVLPVMTGDACDHVLRRTDSDRYLNRLVRGGLFVTATDESPRTYEYHPQFRRFLLESLDGSDRDRLRGLQVRAAGYLADRGSPEHAVELFMAAGAIRRAAAQAEKHAAAMFRAGRTQTLATWAERLQQARAGAPKVFLHLAMAYTDQGNLEAAEAALDRAQAALEGSSSKVLMGAADNQRGLIAFRRGRYKETLEAVEEANRHLAGHRDRQQRAISLRLAALATARENGTLAEAEAMLTEAIGLLNRSTDRYTLTNALADLSTIQTSLGKAHEAYATSLRAHEILQGMGAPYPLATSLNNLAVDAHIQGRYVEAMELFTEAAKYARQAGSPYREAIVLFGQADLFADLDLALQSAELYAQALALATQLDNAGLLRYGCVQSGILHRRRGGASLAHEWLRRARSLEEGTVPPVAVEIQTAALEVSAAPRRATSRLLRLLGDGGATLDASERTLVHYFLARAALASDATEEAVAPLEEALTWAGAHGAEQLLAGEMAFDPELREFARRNLAGNPVLSVVLHRIETMRVVAQQHQQEPAEAEGTANLELVALGQSGMRRGGKRLTELKPLAREVFFYLADRQPVERDVMLETFWPHYNPGRQISNLHTAIYTLRRLLGKEAIQQSGTVYSLDADLPLDYDVVRFERAAEVAQRLPPGDPRKLFALTAAINSYGGQFLPDYASEWVLERRRSLEMLYLDLLASHADEALVRDQPLRAVGTLRQALEIDPLRDDTNLRFIEALGRLGRRSEMVAHYQRYVRLLSEELGLDPPESVRQLYARLIG